MTAFSHNQKEVGDFDSCLDNESKTDGTNMGFYGKMDVKWLSYLPMLKLHVQHYILHSS